MLRDAFALPLALLLWIVFCVAALPGFVMFMHNDLGWHIAAGEWILQHHAIPYADPWSYTACHFPWVNLAWGWDVLAALIYQYAALEGHMVLTFSTGFLCLILIYLSAKRLGAAEWPSAMAALAAMCCLPFYGLPDIFLSSTPQLVSYVFTLWLMYRLRGEHFPLWFPPVIMVLWVNMHNSFPLGLGIIGIYGLEALWLKQGKRFRALLLSGMVASAVTMINPYGWEAYEVVLRNSGHIHQDYVTEWQPLSQIFSSALVVTFLPCIFLILLYAFAVWRAVREPKKQLFPYILLSLILLIASLWQYRFFSLWLLVSAPVIATLFRVSGIRHQALHIRPLVLSVSLLLAMIPWVMAEQYPEGVRPASFRYPEKAAQYIARHYPYVKVLNHWNIGSWMILYQREKMRPLIDGRAATAYPDSVFSKLVPLWRDEDVKSWQALLEAYPPDVIFWLAVDKKGVATLETLPGWRKAYADEDGVVFVRK